VLLVGLTGGIGAGKSTVASLLAERGAVVIDADQVARDVVEPDQPAFAALVEEFGPDIVGADGSLDRTELAARAFATPEGKAALDAITHPAIHAEFGRRMVEAPPDAIVVLDVPLLVESKTAAERGYEIVIVVEAPEEVRLDRLEGRGLDRADATARMRAQASDEARRAVATHVLDNGGDHTALVAQVDALWSDLRTRHAEKSTEAEADTAPDTAPDAATDVASGTAPDPTA
jgi:dephospho-CoA kinase